MITIKHVNNSLIRENIYKMLQISSKRGSSSTEVAFLKQHTRFFRDKFHPPNTGGKNKLSFCGKTYSISLS